MNIENDENNEEIYVEKIQFSKMSKLSKIVIIFCILILGTITTAKIADSLSGEKQFEKYLTRASDPKDKQFYIKNLSYDTDARSHLAYRYKEVNIEFVEDNDWFVYKYQNVLKLYKRYDKKPTTPLGDKDDVIEVHLYRKTDCDPHSEASGIICSLIKIFFGGEQIYRRDYKKGDRLWSRLNEVINKTPQKKENAKLIL